MILFYLISRPVFTFLLSKITSAPVNRNTRAAAADVPTTNVPMVDVLATSLPVASIPTAANEFFPSYIKTSFHFSILKNHNAGAGAIDVSVADMLVASLLVVSILATIDRSF